jgi:hypothetical protein
VDTAEVLEGAEGVLDEVTAAITFIVVADGALAVATLRVNRRRPTLSYADEVICESHTEAEYSGRSSEWQDI